MLPICTCVISADNDNSPSDKNSLYGTVVSGVSSFSIKLLSVTLVTPLLCRPGGVNWHSEVIILVKCVGREGRGK